MLKQTIFLFIFSILSLKGYSQTELWGTTSEGGEFNAGTIYKTDIYGKNYKVVHNFHKIEVSGPYYTQLTIGKDSMLYGMCEAGIIFKFNPIDEKIYTLFEFGNPLNGAEPLGSLLQANDGLFYGMTKSGGQYNKGVLFSFDVVSLKFVKLLDFNGTNGANPRGSLIQASNGLLYGMTFEGGNSNGLGGMGVLFSYDTKTNDYKTHHAFNGNSGINPRGDLFQASDGKLYGMTENGSFQEGVLFSFEPSSNKYEKLVDFDSIKGSSPRGHLIEGVNGLLYGITQVGGENNLGTIFNFNPKTKIFTKEFDFENKINGMYPFGSLMLAKDGMMYGYTSYGGQNSQGILFQFDYLNHIFTKKFDFDGVNFGSTPFGTPTQTYDGMIYGMTYEGGKAGGGVLFKFNPGPPISSIRKIVDLGYASDGRLPYGTLVQGTDKNLYGMTQYGGYHNNGTIFRINPNDDSLTKLYDFSNAYNLYNLTSSLIFASDGNLYGTSNKGGKSDVGILFQFNPVSNSLTTKIEFDGTNGYEPTCTLLDADAGLIYGTTSRGGNQSLGTIFSYSVLDNSLKTIFEFNGSETGANPDGALFKASDGMIYGVARAGGKYEKGVLFMFNPTNNTFSKKFDFKTYYGEFPVGTLVQKSDSFLIGITENGGTNDIGVIFQYNLKTSILEPIFNFESINGSYPQYSLLKSTNSMVYGVTYNGGNVNEGTMFQFDFASKTFKKTHDFHRFYGSHPLSGLVEIEGKYSSINTFNKIANFQPYPNPSNGVFALNLTSNSTLTVYNSLGQVILSKSANGGVQTLNLCNQPDGVYFLKILQKDIQQSFKLVKQQGL